MIKGKRVLDLSRIIVGPYATMVLADLGLQIIKVQSPQGDPTRQWGPPFLHQQSTYFLSVNRNKKSISLDLKNHKDLSILYKMISQSDVLIENYIPGVTDRLQINYDTVSKYNSNLIYCSISGYGDFGFKKNQPAFDQLIQAEAGFMHLTGDQDYGPYKLGFAVTDVITALYASNAILAGIIYQQQNGKGIHIQTSLFECAIAALINQASNFLNGNIDPMRIGNHHPNIIPYGLYYTKNKPIIIAVGTNSQYHALIVALKLDRREEFQTNQQRITNRQVFNKYLNQRLGQMEVEECIKLLRKNKVPCAEINSLKEIFTGQLVRELGMIEQDEGVKMIRNPLRNSEGKTSKLMRPPKLNENRQQILKMFDIHEEI